LLLFRQLTNDLLVGDAQPVQGYRHFSAVITAKADLIAIQLQESGFDLSLTGSFSPYTFLRQRVAAVQRRLDMVPARGIRITGRYLDKSTFSEGGCGPMQDCIKMHQKTALSA
jgi:hypothetical protein